MMTSVGVAVPSTRSTCLRTSRPITWSRRHHIPITIAATVAARITLVASSVISCLWTMPWISSTEFETVVIRLITWPLVILMWNVRTVFAEIAPSIALLILGRSASSRRSTVHSWRSLRVRFESPHLRIVWFPHFSSFMRPRFVGYFRVG